MMVTKYVRKKTSDTWHWCTNCGDYPKGSDLEVTYTRPSFDLCNQCKAKEADRTCQQ